VVEISHTVGKGVIVYWTLAESGDRDRLKSYWEAIGLGKFVPERRPNTAILRDALEEVFKGRFLVRPLSAADGFVVVREDRGADENAYVPVCTAKVLPGETAQPTLSGVGVDTVQILAAYSRLQSQMTNQQMSSALTKVVSHLLGTRLRPTGGFYWLPGFQLDQWKLVADGVEKSSIGRATCYVLQHDLDASGVQAVVDAIANEVNSESDRIAADIFGGELGKRALESRKQEAAAMRRKVAEYESLLGASLSNLTKRLDGLDQSVAVATLTLAGRAAAGDTLPAGNGEPQPSPAPQPVVDDLPTIFDNPLPFEPVAEPAVAEPAVAETTSNAEPADYFSSLFN